VLQYREYVRYGKLVTGIDESQLNVVFAVNMRVQIFVKELIQVQYCTGLICTYSTILYIKYKVLLYKQWVE